jgi:hypothetical protein
MLHGTLISLFMAGCNIVDLGGTIVLIVGLCMYSNYMLCGVGGSGVLDLIAWVTTIQCSENWID